jgi:hypothetical protein
VGGSGDDTLTAGPGPNDILFGGSGTTAYRVGSSFGQDTVNNAGSANTPDGEIDLVPASPTRTYGSSGAATIW